MRLFIVVIFILLHSSSWAQILAYGCGLNTSYVPLDELTNNSKWQDVWINANEATDICEPYDGWILVFEEDFNDSYFDEAIWEKPTWIQRQHIAIMSPALFITT